MATVAGIVILVTTGGCAAPRMVGETPPPTTRDTLYLNVMDLETGQPARISVRQWKEMPAAPDTNPLCQYKQDPKTKKIYCFILTCIACGAKIPHVKVAKGESLTEAQKNYLCPDCKQPAYPPEVWNPDLR
jgi:hypothetical protein